MFTQIIRAKTSDRRTVRAGLDRWLKEVQPGSIGWLGTTAGVTEDGDVFILARFVSDDAAKANSERPEQSAWWAEMQKAFDGAATFQASSIIFDQSVGDPDTAGFVQVMDAQTSDPERSVHLMNSTRDAMVANRPDILCSIIMGHGHGKFTNVIYFVSEEEARKGESKEIPAEVQATMQEMQSLSVGTPTFLDIKEPWLDSPK